MLNTYLPIVICCSFATKIKSHKGNVVIQPTLENGLEKPSEILTFHIRSVSKEQLVKQLGTVSNIQIAQVKECLDDILTL